MLTAENITFSAGKKDLVRNISLQFGPGKINLILGPNGAGKTTLLKILAGQQNGYSGNVHYGERNLKSFTTLELAQRRALLSQHTELAFPLRVEEVVMMGRYPHFTTSPSTRDNDAVEETIRLFDLASLRKRNYMTLSGGEKQRVHFARVIAQIWYPLPGQSRYLLLDEPLSFLDIYFQYDFMNKIMELMDGNNVVVAGIIHDLHLAVKYADQSVVLKEGQLVAAGDRAAVFTSKMIREVYRVEAQVHDKEGKLSLSF